jgi:hypothetical protein
MTTPTPTELEKCVERIACDKALHCLYLAAEQSIVLDVQNKVYAYINKLESKIQQLVKDKERLDWMDKNRTNHIYDHFKFNPSLAASQKTWRTAIDAAREQERTK